LSFHLFCTTAALSQELCQKQQRFSGVQTKHACVWCREKAGLAEEVLQKAVQLKELKAASSISQEASDISEQVHDCCQQQVLLVDLSRIVLLATLTFACHPKLCLLSKASPAIPSFASCPKLCLLSQTWCQ